MFPDVIVKEASYLWSQDLFPDVIVKEASSGIWNCTFRRMLRTTACCWKFGPMSKPFATCTKSFDSLWTRQRMKLGRPCCGPARDAQVDRANPWLCDFCAASFSLSESGRVVAAGMLLDSKVTCLSCHRTCRGLCVSCERMSPGNFATEFPVHRLPCDVFWDPKEVKTSCLC